MAMDRETKSEVIIASMLAAFVAFLWWMNKQNGGGTGLEQGSTSLPSSGFQIQPAPGSGDFSYQGGNITLNGSGALAGSCGCASTGASTPVYGSTADQTAALAQAGVTTGDYTNWN